MDAYPAKRTVHNQTLTAVHPDCFSLFSTKEAADEYIAKYKEKTLAYYENKLLSIKNYAFYSKLKKTEPKLYWLKVLQIIADDLNDGEGGNVEIYLENGKYNTESGSMTFGSPIFSSLHPADKAIKIMGDKLDYIYKS